MRKKTTLALVPVAALFAAAGWGAAKAADRRHINLAARPVTAPFSDGVVVGETLYLAGRIGLDPKTGRPPADAAEEARLLLDGMKAVLAQAGMEMDDLVSVQVFCPDLALYDTWNGVYQTYFKGTPPARAFVGSGPLLRGGRFEAMGIAVRR
jgi:reactive intermediate/imine deaminase